MVNADSNTLKVFAGSANRGLAEEICGYLGIPLGQGRTEPFPDGEMIVKVEEDVRGRDCYIIQSTCNPVSQHLMELLIYIDCLKRASAQRITAVIPYFGFARQDRKDEGRVPITAKMVANLITAATHPVFVGLAMERMQEAPISRVVVTDTIPCGRRCEPIADKLVELSVADLLGEAIFRIHANESISAMFRKGSTRQQ